VNNNPATAIVEPTRPIPATRHGMPRITVSVHGVTMILDEMGIRAIRISRSAGCVGRADLDGLIRAASGVLSDAIYHL